MANDFEVLDANSAFYRAFAARDLAAMESLWATLVPVACIHPGWDALHGRDLVIESFRAILKGPSSPGIRCSHAFVQALGQIALVICREHVDGGELVATNVFVREAGGWKLVHHQASPLAPSDEELPEEPPN
ncbi:MAG TPA: nuclear transport factor 2 family protein [Anaeromyxobacteraceae bacterium]|nr:nuclear transport factor 2 family protein [Anaeromyxobacteraceae bacterium]